VVNSGGEEIYFSIPIKEPSENPQEVVEKGTLAYWHDVYFLGTHSDEYEGPTSPINVIGRITADFSLLKTLTKADVTVEK
jgi:hypothetical protein